MVGQYEAWSQAERAIDFAVDEVYHNGPKNYTQVRCLSSVLLMESIQNVKSKI